MATARDMQVNIVSAP